MFHHGTRDKGNPCLQIKIYCPALLYSDIINMVLTMSLRVQFWQEVCSETLFLCDKRQYTEQFADNQVEQ